MMEEIEKNPGIVGEGPIYKESQNQKKLDNFVDVQNLLYLNLEIKKTIFHPSEFDDQTTYDCLMKAVNGLLGFCFFSHRDQALRMIKLFNRGCNVKKAIYEKVQGGLRIEYF